MTPTTALRCLAIPLGLAVLATQIFIGLDYLGGWDYFGGKGSTIDVASMVLVFVTLAVAPTLVALAFKAGHHVSGAALVVAFVAWIAYSIPTTLGRTSEVAESKVLTAEQANQSAAEAKSMVSDALLMATARLEIAQTERKAAHDAAEKRCKRSPNSDACGKLQKREKTATSYESDMQKRVDDLMVQSAKPKPPPQVADAGSETIAWLLSYVSEVAPQSVRHSKSLAFAFGLDLFLWSLIHLGISPGRRKVEREEPENVSEPVTPEYSGNVTQLHPVAKALKDCGGEVGSNRRLAHLMACSDGWASKRAGEAVALGLVERQQVGKEVRIRLKAAG